MPDSLLDNYYKIISWILPGICILGTFFINIIIHLVAKDLRASKWSFWATLVGLSCAYYATLQVNQRISAEPGISLWNNLLHINTWATYTHLISIGVTFLMTLIIYTDSYRPSTSISLMMLLALLLGTYLLPLSNHWLIVYVSLTCISLASTVLIYNHGSQRSSILASQKYLVYSTLAGALMLFGMSYMYGLAGTLEISPSLMEVSHTPWLSTIFPIGLLLTLGGAFMVLGSFPYQFWVADIYAVTPFSLVAHFSTISKVAVLGLLVKMVKVMPHLMPPALYTIMTDLWAIIAAITMLIGHFAALSTRNATKLLAYGSIAQTGFLLALLMSDLRTYTHVTYYLIIYTLMNIASWLGVSLLHQSTKSFSIQDYAGLGKKLPVASICLTVSMLSLIGMPPTAGFTAKLMLWSKLWESIQASNNPFVLALWIVSLLGTIMSLYYYLKIPYILFSKPLKHEAIIPARQPYIQLLVIILTILLVGLFVVGV